MDGVPSKSGGHSSREALQPGAMTPSPNHRPVIVFPSPRGDVETALRVGPPEKKGHKAWRWPAVRHLLRSGLEVKVAECGNFWRFSGEMQVNFSAPGLRGAES